MREVAKEYSIPYDELKSRVSEVFACEQLENLKHRVDISTVVLYLKGIKLADSNLDLSIRLMKEVLFVTIFTLAGLFIFV